MIKKIASAWKWILIFGVFSGILESDIMRFISFSGFWVSYGIIFYFALSVFSIYLATYIHDKDNGHDSSYQIRLFITILTILWSALLSNILSNLIHTDTFLGLAEVELANQTAYLLKRGEWTLEFAIHQFIGVVICWTIAWILKKLPPSVFSIKF